MFQNDYLMRIILQFVQALQRALREREVLPSERAADLEQAVGDAVNIDPNLLLSMDAKSVVSMLQLGDLDEDLGEYVVRSLYLEAELLEEMGEASVAELRRAQADAISEAYDLGLVASDVAPEALEAFLAEREESSAKSSADAL